MIEYKVGDILAEDVEAIVNTVNCVGVMGRGIALQFKKAYPENYKVYAAACKRKEVQPGKMLIHDLNSFMNPRYIVNFPTKRHWRGKSRIEDIESGLVALAQEIEKSKIRSIAIPPLGSGLGGLRWDEVRPLIEDALKDFDDLRVVIFEPRGALQAQAMVKSKDVPNMTKGRAALVSLMQSYLNGLMDPSISLLEVHKLMYFLQESGQKLKLRYQKAIYGPYAGNLSHVLNKIEGHLVSGYADGGDAPDKELQLVPGAVKDAQAFLNDDKDTKAHLKKVADLVEGFETPFGLELLATVHWVSTKMDAVSIEDVIAETYAWNDRKKQFTPRQIEIAHKVLEQKNWLN